MLDFGKIRMDAMEHAWEVNSIVKHTRDTRFSKKDSHSGNLRRFETDFWPVGNHASKVAFER